MDIAIKVTIIAVIGMILTFLCGFAAGVVYQIGRHIPRYGQYKVPKGEK